MSITTFGWSLPFARPRASAPRVEGHSSGTCSPASPGAVTSCGLACVPEAPAWPWVIRLANVIRRGRVLVLTVTHILAFALIYLLAYVVRFDGVVPIQYLKIAAATLPAVVGIKLIAFFGTGSHRGWWRYATFADMTHMAETA